MICRILSHERCATPPEPNMWRLGQKVSVTRNSTTKCNSSTYLLLFVPVCSLETLESVRVRVLQYDSIKLKTLNLLSIAVCIHYVLHRCKALSREVSFYRQNYISNE